MNLDNFIEDYYIHIMNGCDNKKCLYKGCLKCEDKDEFFEHL